MKSKMIIMAITALVGLTLFTSCEKIKGKGEVITETRSTETFSSISLSMSATVYFTQDSVFRIEITGQENIIREVETKVEGNQLKIQVKHGVSLVHHEPIRVYVSAPHVTDLDVSGSGDIFTQNPWDENAISLCISGSGSINIANVNSTDLSATISGSGKIISAFGKVTREDLKISGSGTIDLRSVEAEKVYSTTSGSGNTYIHATEQLDVTISGSGDIWYYGNPAVNTQISGSGNLHRM